MDKKELPNKKEKGFPAKGGAEAAPKVSGLSGKIFGVVKFILGILLLPFVYSSSIAFIGQIGLADGLLQRHFWCGGLSFILIYLFVWEPAPIYGWGHKILEIVFSFFKPFVKVAPFLLPIYTLVILILYGITSFFNSSAWLIQYTMFLCGFTIVMHLVFSSKTIRGNKSDFLKANYIFGFSFIYIINIGLLALGLSLILKGFSFVAFSGEAYSLAGDIFYAVFKQLFLR